jgi:hypothetical protein
MIKKWQFIKFSEKLLTGRLVGRYTLGKVSFVTEQTNLTKGKWGDFL